MTDDVPQVIAITKAGKGGKLPVKREVRQYLGLEDGKIFLEAGSEVLLRRRRARLSARKRRMESGATKIPTGRSTSSRACGSSTRACLVSNMN